MKWKEIPYQDMTKKYLGSTIIIMGMLEDGIMSLQLTFPPIVFKVDDVMLSDKGYLYAVWWAKERVKLTNK